MNKFYLNFILFVVILNSISSAPTPTIPIPQEYTEMQATSTTTSQENQVTTTIVELDGRSNATTTSQEDQVTTTVVELDGRSNASMTQPITATAPSLPNEPYDCSIMNRSQKARAISAFQKGLSLIVDELNHRVLQVKYIEHIKSIVIPFIETTKFLSNFRITFQIFFFKYFNRIWFRIQHFVLDMDSVYWMLLVIAPSTLYMGFKE